MFATFAALHVPGAVTALTRPGPSSAEALAATTSVLASLVLWSVLTALALAALRRGRHVPRGLLAAAFAVDVVVLTLSGLSPPRPGNTTTATVGILAVCGAAALLMRPRLLPVVVLPAVVGQAVLLRAADTAASTAQLVADVGTVATASVATSALVAWLGHDRRTAQAALADAALRDPLTGLLNRRGLTEGLPALLRGSGRRGGPHHGTTPTVVVLDVDHFKGVNDRRGHDVGDAVLVAVAAAMRDCSRDGDLLVRLGGEEVAWVARWSSPADAATAAERLRALVAERTAALGEPVTLSAGVAALPRAAPGAHGGVDGEEAAEALRRALVQADVALYRAKGAGRDRVEVAALIS